MSKTSVVTVVCSCLISSLYLSSFSCMILLSSCSFLSFSCSFLSFSCSLLSLSLAILCASSSCCIMSCIVISLGASLLLLLLGVGLLSGCWPLSLTSFPALLVSRLIAVGETFFLGVASADAESESLVNRLSRLGGLPSAPPCGPSLFLFSAYSLSLIGWSPFSCSLAPPCAAPSCLPSLAIPPPLVPPRLL
jgi:hypothetical protein